MLCDLCFYVLYPADIAQLDLAVVGYVAITAAWTLVPRTDSLCVGAHSSRLRSQLVVDCG